MQFNDFKPLRLWIPIWIVFSIVCSVHVIWAQDDVWIRPTVPKQALALTDGVETFNRAGVDVGEDLLGFLRMAIAKGEDDPLNLEAIVPVKDSPSHLLGQFNKASYEAIPALLRVPFVQSTVADAEKIPGFDMTVSFVFKSSDANKEEKAEKVKALNAAGLKITDFAGIEKNIADVDGYTFDGLCVVAEPAGDSIDLKKLDSLITTTWNDKLSYVRLNSAIVIEQPTSATRDAIASLFSVGSSIPNDPLFKGQVGITQAGFPEVWRTRHDDQEFAAKISRMRVAVIDSGVDKPHPDFKDANLKQINQTGVNQLTSDHGTQVTGIIAAVGENNVGISGALWKWKPEVLHYRTDIPGTANISTNLVIKSLEEIRRTDNVFVVNASFGGPGFNPYTALLDDLGEKGIIFVAAAGNGGEDNDVPAQRIFPASHTGYNVISVAAVNQSGNGLWRTPGNASAHGRSVDIAAPGDRISTLNRNGGFTRNFSGTSFAAPMVAAACLMAYARLENPTPSKANAQLVIQQILSNAGNLRASGNDWGASGNNPILNVRFLEGDDIPPPERTPSVSSDVRINHLKPSAKGMMRESQELLQGAKDLATKLGVE